MKKPTLTDAGTSVRLLIKAEPAATCAEVADVNTGNDWFTDEAFVKVQLRNRAAELGANVATLDAHFLQQPGRHF